MDMNNSALLTTDKLWYQLNEMVLSFEKSMNSNNSVMESKKNKTVNYHEISITEAPSLIKKVLSKGFNSFSSIQFYVGTDGTYKVVASNNDEKCSIYFEK